MKRLGVTLVEVMMATMVLGTVMAGLVLFQAATVKTNQKERDRAFALQKALQIMEELKVYAAADGAAQLDDFGQSETTYSFNLTTENVSVPSAALSDNTPDKVGYRYVRQIWVKPLPRDKGARQVTVRVLLSDRKAAAGAPAGAKPLATVSNIFKSQPTVVLPSQAYEVYRISMWEFANATGENNGTVTNAYQYPPLYTAYGARGADYLQNATSGLDMTIRRQISIAAYGRDTYYAPLHNNDDYWAHINSGYPNATAGSDVTSPSTVPFEWVYFRPGMYGSDQNARLAPGNGQSRYFYSTDGNQAYEPTAPTRGQVTHAPTASALYENQKPYTFADQNNHALRYIEHYEKALTRNAWRTNSGAYQALKNEPDLTLRTLLDQLIEGKLKNAIIVNDHAEVFPMIPMRNYSDAAKVPSQDWNLTDLATMWGVTPASADDAKKGARARLVTHPYKLEHDTNEVIQLRVHPYKTSDPGNEPPAPYRQAQIVLPGMGPHLGNWNSSGGAAEDVEIQVLQRVNHKWRLLGGDSETFWYSYFSSDPAMVVGLGATDMKAYRWVRVWPPGNTNTLKPNDDGGNNDHAIPYVPEIRNQILDGDPFIQATNDAATGLMTGDVVMRFKNLPYTVDRFDSDEKRRNNNGQGNGNMSWENVKYGLDDNTRLHGAKYFPDPYLPDLAEPDEDDDGLDKPPRNTMRVRVLFKCTTPRVVEALTTIGSDPNLYRHQAPNRSRTWTWVKAPGGATTVPDTEQFQLVGDPRHNPYKDVRDKKHYNRYFGDLDDAYFEEDGDLSWNYFADTANGWGPNNVVGGKNVGRADMDVPRYFELWRRGLLNSNAMFATITSDAFKYVVLGGEYNDTPHSKRPMTGEDNKKATYNERNNPTLTATKDGKWYAKPWLGELYPDDEWGEWINGNLPSKDYRRLEAQDIDAFKKAFVKDETAFKRTRRVDEWGPVSFYNASQRFAYKSHTGNATITADSGRAVTADLKALLRETLAVTRTFTFDDPGVNLPSDWNSNESQSTRTTLEAGVVSGSSSYYKAGDGNHAVAPFTMRRTENGQTKSAYFLAFSPWNTWNSGNDPMSMQRVFMASLLQGYMDMASPTYKSGANKGSQRIRLLPRIKVTQPEDDAIASGSNLVVAWEPEWVRWDGEAYSRQFTDYGSTADKPTLAYFVKYSENGTNWYYANSSPVMSTWIGQHSHYNDFTKDYATNANSINLNISAFKNKQYQIRIEAFRVDPGYEGVHHAYSQFSINRVK